MLKYQQNLEKEAFPPEQHAAGGPLDSYLHADCVCILTLKSSITRLEGHPTESTEAKLLHLGGLVKGTSSP